MVQSLTELKRQLKESVFPVILFNIDRKKIIWTGICGAIGWMAYLLVYNYAHSSVSASFTGAFIVSIYSELMAKKLKTPAIQFSIPGIFPLVPGITAYNTINSIVEQNYSLAYSKGMETVAVGGAIAFGIMLSSTTFRFILKLMKNTSHKEKQYNR
ncbi:threonine/serine exporter family protein [Clostridiaceae bacterium UIB06]|uniref:Threonine/serine exporter family protein n=1 Tax=Clostridium thailandense TaxID=2794346 RepID=A0A949TYX0_9CLOT|nr:threonine/serine exporter family protein [Clostridium thailandense]MCH5137851.1 threonine/serine exporter family protein [Clostridiaceae bacterium UIB06]